ncbi:MAG: response regulator [Ferruginibacter sp.]|nr:response regulator [Ferruginibacter sp.]
MLVNPLFLLVDDDPDDLMLLKDAIHSIDKNIVFAEAMDGRSALNYLNNIKDLTLLPSLVVLDINMPVLNGREVLAIIKSENQLKNLPVVVFTTSSYPGDVEYCKQFDVELITKPFGMRELVDISKKLVNAYV